MTPPNPPVRLGLLASGRGSNLQSLLQACKSGQLAAEAVVVISNRAQAAALQHARLMGIPALHLDLDAGDTAADAALLHMLSSRHVDMVLLAGYLRPIAAGVLKHYSGRILNIHPGPLPEFGGQGMYGLHVHRAVLAAGRTSTAAVVHLVQENYDTGPVLAERVVPVHPDDTPESLAARVLKEEHVLYADTVRRILNGELVLPGFNVRITG